MTIKKALSQSSGLDQPVGECEDEQVKMIVTNSSMDTDKVEYQKPAYFAVGLVLALTAFTILLPMFVTSNILGLSEDVYKPVPHPPCLNQCQIALSESIPENLTYPAGSPSHPSIFEGWMNLARMANKSIDIAQFYFTMTGADVGIDDPSDWQGEAVLSELIKAGGERGIPIRIVQSVPQGDANSNDTDVLTQKAGAMVRTINMTRLVGAGILHTKLWIVDGKHFYVGSANQDWRSLTQVKELGVLVYSCDCLADDIAKIFDVYWQLAEPNATIPSYWPSELNTKYNKDMPMQVHLNEVPSQVYLSSSPPQLCPKGRTTDIVSIIDVIERAEKFVYIAVMDYFPLMLYTKQPEYWPVIDEALRRVAIEKQVEIRIMASWWNHSSPEIKSYLASLQALSGITNVRIQTKLFEVPIYTEAQRRIPYARVNHNKYMVTDNTAYIGTSNWAGSYFVNTCGIGFIINQTEPFRNEDTSPKIQDQLKAVFERDWNSDYAKPVIEIDRQQKQRQGQGNDEL